MGPIALYEFDKPDSKKIKNTLKWIDSGKQDNNLRTNASEDDLIFKINPDPIMTHRVVSNMKPIIKPDPKNEQDNIHFYQNGKPEVQEDIDETDLQAQNTKDATNTIGVINYTNDPMVGNKILGNTMPLPKKNNLLESNRNKNDEDLICKKFLEKIKQGDGPKKTAKDKNLKAYNFVLENKKKLKKESAKRKRSAKGRDDKHKFSKEMSEQKPVIHRKSYSEVVRDHHKKKMDKPVDEGKKNVVINKQNVYNVNIQNSQLVSSKNAFIHYFSNKMTNNTKQNAKTNLKNNQEILEKGFKKFSQGYTVNKLAKEGLLNRKFYPFSFSKNLNIASKADQYVKVVKSKVKAKRPNSSKKRKVAPYEQRYSMGTKPKPGLLSNSVGLYNGNYGERNANFVNQTNLSLNIGGGTFNQSTKAKESFLSKTVGNENFAKNHNFDSMKSKSTSNSISKKSGPIKATISTDKAKLCKYPCQKVKIPKPSTRQKRPHSSTFIGRDNDMYSKIMKINTKPKKQKEMKVNKRVRSASPGALSKAISQKYSINMANKTKQRPIGGSLYHHN
jgi:hypothetical protein